MQLSLLLSRLLLISSFSILLAACGGGGTGSPLDDNGGSVVGGDGTVTEDSVFTAVGPGGIAITDIDLSFAESTTISIQLLDNTGTPIIAQSVAYTFEVPDPVTKTSINPSQKVVTSGSLNTDNDGFIEVPLLIDDPSVVGTGTLTLTAAGFGTQFEIEVAAAEGVPAFIELALEDINTGLPVTGIDFTSGARVVITVTEGDGGALSSPTIVTASASAGNLSPSSILITGGTGNFTLSRTDGIDDFSAVQVNVVAEVEDAAGDDVIISGSLLSEFLPSGATGGSGAAGIPSSLLPVPFLQDPANPGVAISAISAADPAELVVTVVDFEGTPVSNAIVSVQTSLGELSPSLGNVLTNAAGVATIGVSAGDGESGAAGTLTIGVGDDLQYTTNFEIVDTGTTSNSGLLLSLQLFSANDLSPTTTINSVEPGLLVATLTNVLSGLPVPGEIITVSAEVGEPLLTPISGEILTDSAGQASITVGVGNSEPGAAISILADVADLFSSIQFSVGSAAISLGRDPDGDYSSVDSTTFVLGEVDVDGMGGNSISIAATGSALLTVGVFDGNNDELFDTPLTVNFTSTCADASIGTAVTTVNGIASATFKSVAACEGEVVVTASLAEISGALATGTITVAGSTANSIEFESATPTNIAIAGTGGSGRQETSALIFQVVDDGGEPKQGQSVDFALTTTLGGIDLTADSDISDELGFVTAIVSSGTVPTPVQVIASLSDAPEIATVSDTLVISTGLPDQDSFSVSASILNPGGGNPLDDGVESDITVRASDAFNNPVPDGTPISFTTEYGDISPSCTTINGACTVTWTSSNPRGVQQAITGTMRNLENTACNYNDGTTAFSHTSADLPCPTNIEDFPLGQIYTGRTTILAYALGDESFVDSNGNGFYDYVDANSNGAYDAGEEEPFVDLPEAFRDDNEDGVFGNSDATFDNNGDGACTSDDGRDQCLGWQIGGLEEEFIDLDVDGFYDGDADGLADSTAAGETPSVGNGIYNGSLCTDDSEALGICSSTPVNVRSSVVLIMSDNTTIVDFRNADRSPLGSTDIINVSLAPQNVIILIGDINNNRPVSGTVIEIAAANCELSGDGTNIIGNTNEAGIVSIPLTLSEDDSTDSTSGIVAVTAATTTTFSSTLTKVFNTRDTFTCVDLN